ATTRRPTVPPPPPTWRNWLLVAGLVLSMLILFWPHSAPTVSELSYTDFLSRVRSDAVSTATIDPSGAVTGSLKGGGDYATQIPTAVQDTGLSKELQDHNVEIIGKAAPGTTLLDVILSFLPFILL